jgi:hypothetical protein
MATDSFRGEQMVKRSQYLKVAAKVYGLSKEDSTLAVSGYWHVLYPLTELLPPNNPITQSSSYKLSNLRMLYLQFNRDENKLIEVLRKHRPTIIVTSKNQWRGEADIPNIIKKTNLYEKILFVPKRYSYEKYLAKEIAFGEDPNGWMSAIIYRLKDFK